MAQYAKQHSALAVVSSDSDFLIFPGNWKWWKLTKLDRVDIEIFELSRTELRNHLSLDDSKISIFASLLGNDSISRWYLKAFHRYLSLLRGRPEGNRIADITAFVRRQFPGDGHSQMSDTDYVVEKLMSVPDLANILPLIKKSIKFYSPTEQLDHDNRPIYIDLLYRARRNIPLQIAMSIFDLRRSDFIPYFRMIKPMIQRQIGLALPLLNRPDVDTWEVLTKASHRTRYGKVNIRPKYPDCKSK